MRTWKLLIGSIAAMLCTPALAADWPDLSRAPSVSAGDGSKDAALVIGVERYAFTQQLPGAHSNALAWMSWLKEARKVPMVKPLLNDDATKEGMLEAVSQVAARVKPGGRLWIVYIGHGAPQEGGTDGLLVGVDAQQTASSLDHLGFRLARSTP